MSRYYIGNRSHYKDLRLIWNLRATF